MKSLQSNGAEFNTENLIPKFLLSDINGKDEQWSLKNLKEDSIFCEVLEGNEETHFNVPTIEQHQVSILYNYSLQQNHQLGTSSTPAGMLDNTCRFPSHLLTFTFRITWAIGVKAILICITLIT
jgi:hypothetical protein